MHLVVNAKQEVGGNDLLRRQRDFAADWRLFGHCGFLAGRVTSASLAPLPICPRVAKQLHQISGLEAFKRKYGVLDLSA